VTMTTLADIATWNHCSRDGQLMEDRYSASDFGTVLTSKLDACRVHVKTHSRAGRRSFRFRAPRHPFFRRHRPHTQVPPLLHPLYRLPFLRSSTFGLRSHLDLWYVSQARRRAQSDVRIWSMYAASRQCGVLCDASGRATCGI